MVTVRHAGGGRSLYQFSTREAADRFTGTLPEGDVSHTEERAVYGMEKINE